MYTLAELQFESAELKPWLGRGNGGNLCLLIADGGQDCPQSQETSRTTRGRGVVSSGFTSEESEDGH